MRHKKEYKVIQLIFRCEFKKREKRKKSFGGESIKEKRERWMRADDEALRKSDSDKDRGRKRERKKEKEG